MNDNDGAAQRSVREERSLSPMRKTIAKRLQQSYQDAIHVTVSRNVVAEPVLAAADNVDVPTVTDILLCGLSETLTAHPEFNATFEDGTHRIYEEHNIGVAVDIGDGLVTPVIEDIGAKSLYEVAQRRQDLTSRVMDGNYTMSTFQGGTFTVSNLGVLGVDSFTPVINPPEIAILGIGRTTERAVPGEDGVTFRTEMTLDLSFDHRIVDGADAARFLETLSGNLMAPKQYVDE